MGAITLLRDNHPREAINDLGIILAQSRLFWQGVVSYRPKSGRIGERKVGKDRGGRYAPKKSELSDTLTQVI